MNRKTKYNVIIALFSIIIFLFLPEIITADNIDNEGPYIVVNNGFGATNTMIWDNNPIDIRAVLLPGHYNGLYADWWVLAEVTPYNNPPPHPYVFPTYLFYMDRDFQWHQILSINEAKPIYQGPLEYLNMSIFKINHLFHGNFIIYFGFDAMNGVIDQNVIYRKHVLYVLPTQ